MPLWLEHLGIWLWNIPEGLGALIGALIGLLGVAFATWLSYHNLIRSQEHEAKLSRDREDDALRRRRLRTAAALEGELEAIEQELGTGLQTIAILRDELIDFAREDLSTEITLPYELYPTLPSMVFEASRSNLDCLNADLIRAVALAYTTVGEINAKAKTRRTIPTSFLQQAIANASGELRFASERISEALSELRDTQMEERTSEKGQ